MENKRSLWYPPEKTGTLSKQGPPGKASSWKRRHFVVRDCMLFYFQSRSAYEKGDAVGTLPLEACAIVPSPLPKREYAFTLRLNEVAKKGEVKRATYVLAAEDGRELGEWMDALRQASEPKRELRTRLDKLREQVMELEKHWREVAKEEHNLIKLAQPPPLLPSTTTLRALDKARREGVRLADELEEVQRAIELARKMIAGKDASAAALTEACIRLEQRLRALHGDTLPMYLLTELETARECVAWLCPALEYLEALETEVLGLETCCRHGSGDRAEVAQVLQHTLGLLDDMEAQGVEEGTEDLVDEAELESLRQELWNFDQAARAPIPAEYLS